MTFVEVDSSRMMSVIMATGVEQCWRGQPTVVFKIPFQAWKEFVVDNKDLLRDRVPFDHAKYVDNPQLNINWFKVFMWDIVHSQLNELSISSNRGRDSTIILPVYEDGARIFTFDSVVEYSDGLSDEEFESVMDSLWLFKPAPNVFELGGLSEHNCMIYYYLVGLQHLTMKKDLRNFRVDWR